MRHIIIDLYASGDTDAVNKIDLEAMKAAIKRTVDSFTAKMEVNSSVGLLEPGSDRYVVEATDWSERYEAKDSYNDMTDEQKKKFIEALNREVYDVIDHFSEVAYSHGLQVLERVSKWEE
jgi:hypothetical protein